MSKEQYDSLLKVLDEMSTEYHSEHNSDLSEGSDSLQHSENNSDLLEDSDPLETLKFDPFPEPLPEYPFGPYTIELSIILKSRIFQDGQLKGRKLSGGSNIYENYQIIDLEKFIWLLCDRIHSFRPVDGEGRDFYSLSKLLDAIEGCSDTVKRLLGKPEGAQLAAIGEKVKTQVKTMKESSPQFLIKEGELTDQITDLFKEHIPNTPKKTIYSGVCNFLKLFDIKCRPNTLAMRDYRRRIRKAQLVNKIS